LPGPREYGWLLRRLLKGNDKMITVGGQLEKHPEFYRMLSIDDRKRSAFYLWHAGKYFDRITHQIKDLRIGVKYKIDEEGYIIEKIT
jgi:hypothetical protein